MIIRFGTGYFAVTIDLGGPKYTKKEVLEKSITGDYEISKLETKSPSTEWVCYLLKDTNNDKEIAYIRGYHWGKETFHIQRIKNLLKDRISGYRHIPKISKIMDEDLKKEGVKELTCSAYLKFAPMAMKRYGFRPDEKNTQYIGRTWWRYVPLPWKPLKKKLD
ncbi:hypothetical protein GOV14_03010 [Candidatus Pacearchaeota archaeon]|nr:hypothetical protein [Candidatus Pacearchaeota archaeon]